MAHLEDPTTPETRLEYLLGGAVPPRLMVLAGDHPGRSFPVTGDTTIGRGPKNSFRIDHEGISRSHARIWSPTTDAWVIQDLSSRNGTFVNGQRVTERALRMGDRIHLGSETVLLFTLGDPGESRIVSDERLASVSHVATTVAHDFNNLIGVVLSSLEYLQEEPTLKHADGDTAEALADAQTAAREASDLAKRLLSLGRPPRPSSSSTDLTQIANQATQLVKRLLPPNISLTLQLEPRLLVEADPDEVHQIMVNLCVNARDAMPDGGTLTMAARRATDEDLPTTLPRGRRYVICSVQDTGTGVSDEVKSRMFRPFFSTKPSGQGTGLGLAMVHTAISSRGGALEVDSAPGQGCRITFILPAASNRLRAHPTLTDIQPESHLRQLRIAVADLDPLTLRSTKRSLTRAGHTVETITSREGVRQLTSRDDIDGVLIDPRLLGEDPAIVAQLTERRIPVVVYGPAERSQPNGGGPSVEKLAKPSRPQSIAAAFDRAASGWAESF